MVAKIEFDTLVEDAIRQANLSSLRPVVEKELLHYDILFCLSEAGLLRTLTFRGGTSLRLCYGSNRFSEDLDFAGGRDFCSADLSAMKTCIEGYVGSRYGLEVTVKGPDELRDEPDSAEVRVDKWQISVTTAPKRKDLPQQRIKIEVANIPAYTRTPRQLVRNYTVLPDGYTDILIGVESLNEVMADKLISFPATTRRIRYRDMWDLVWLRQQGASADTALVMKKINDYRLEGYAQRLQERIASLPSIIQDGRFHAEMKRFIPAAVYDTSLGREGFNDFLETMLTELLTQLKRDLGKPDSPGFRL
ncbi:TPA: nucleotidyl transferase AbiEii/AbiGii toxin family protein [Enterobacter hormaechei subsp. xiangfangensis]|nr:nucleotidyl transferase AbiEii/AbiGii toxin family protein [Enterobacter hormaechei subsp. xiangfangensis]